MCLFLISYVFLYCPFLISIFPISYVSGMFSFSNFICDLFFLFPISYVFHVFSFSNFILFVCFLFLISFLFLYILFSDFLCFSQLLMFCHILNLYSFKCNVYNMYHTYYYMWNGFFTITAL